MKKALKLLRIVFNRRCLCHRLSPSQSPSPLNTFRSIFIFSVACCLSYLHVLAIFFKKSRHFIVVWGTLLEKHGLIKAYNFHEMYSLQCEKLRLAHSVERLTAKREVAGSVPGTEPILTVLK